MIFCKQPTRTTYETKEKIEQNKKNISSTQPAIIALSATMWVDTTDDWFL